MTPTEKGLVPAWRRGVSETAPCGCPVGPAVRITDEAKHQEWHELVVAQGGPEGRVDAVSLLAARGFITPGRDYSRPAVTS